MPVTETPPIVRVRGQFPHGVTKTAANWSHRSENPRTVPLARAHARGSRAGQRARELLREPGETKGKGSMSALGTHESRRPGSASREPPLSPPVVRGPWRPGAFDSSPAFGPGRPATPPPALRPPEEQQPARPRAPEPATRPPAPAPAAPEPPAQLEPPAPSPRSGAVPSPSPGRLMASPGALAPEPGSSFSSPPAPAPEPEPEIVAPTRPVLPDDGARGSEPEPCRSGPRARTRPRAGRAGCGGRGLLLTPPAAPAPAAAPEPVERRAGDRARDARASGRAPPVEAPPAAEAPEIEPVELMPTSCR